MIELDRLVGALGQFQKQIRFLLILEVEALDFEFRAAIQLFAQIFGDEVALLLGQLGRVFVQFDGEPVGPFRGDAFDVRVELVVRGQEVELAVIDAAAGGHGLQNERPVRIISRTIQIQLFPKLEVGRRRGLPEVGVGFGVGSDGITGFLTCYSAGAIGILQDSKTSQS